VFTSGSTAVHRRRPHERTRLEAQCGEAPSYESFYMTQHDEMAPRFVNAYGPPSARHENREPPTLHVTLDGWMADDVANNICLEPIPARDADRAHVTPAPALHRHDYVFIRHRFGLSLTRHRRELTTIIDDVRGTGEESSSMLHVGFCPR
jgi:hypothetical protein